MTWIIEKMSLSCATWEQNRLKNEHSIEKNMFILTFVVIKPIELLKVKD